MRWFLVTAMVATALDAALSSAAATGRAAAMLAIPTQILNHIVDSSLPAIPDLRGTPAAATATSASLNIFDLQQQNQAVSASWTTAAQVAPAPTNDPTGTVSV
jgi:hypothetical protein